MSNPTSDRVVIVSGARTPFARARTVFQKMPPSALGGVAIRETVVRSGMDPKLVDEIYYGIVSAPAEGSNIAREALFDSGLPPSIPCTTVNRYCASAAEAVAGIMGKICNGQIDIGVAGGVESISSIRALFSQEATDFFQDLARAKTLAQRFAKISEFSPKMLAPQAPGIKEPTTGLSMGQSADLMARLYKVTREEQDQWAMNSHLKAHQAWEKGFYKTHVVPVATPDGKVVDRDTDVRADSSMEKLSQLKPVFYKDGTITAGNASPLTDGASACLMMKESKARELGLPILGAIRSYVATAVDIQKQPLLIAPAYGFPKALKRAGVNVGDIDLFEIHEAFAGQVLATLNALKTPEIGVGALDHSKINVNGGSIPLGHPFGATGVRVILQCLHELKARKKNLGMISICAAGGLGVVAVLEAV